MTACLAILADIHGNLPALEVVLDDAERHAVDGIVVAGDLTGGPQDVQVIQGLHSLGSRMIRGNREEYLLDFDIQEGKHWAFLRLLYHRLDNDTLTLIASLPGQDVIAMNGAEPIHVVHGSLQSSRDMLLPERDPDTLQVFKEAELLSPDCNPTKWATPTLGGIDENILVCGHTHIPWAQRHKKKLALNPGSVGMPINGDPRAQYAILTWQNDHWQVKHRAIPYDIDRTRAAFHQDGLLEEGGGFAKACLLNIETGQNVPGRFIKYARQVATQAGFESKATLPDTMWEYIETTFD
ncbi:MAG: metallophosphoesterase [Anaerolineae bacterium]